jgi:hypothetical protein
MIAPSVPTGLVAFKLQPTSVNLKWNPSSDNVKVVGYNVYVNNSLFNSTIIKDTFYTVLGLTTYTSYSIHVKAVDANNNLSGASGLLQLTTPDFIPPTKPGTLTASNITSSTVQLQWNKSTDNVQVVGYKLFNYNTLLFTFNSTDTTGLVTGLEPNKNYSQLNIKAIDSSGNLSIGTNQVAVRTLSGNDITTQWNSPVENTAIFYQAFNQTLYIDLKETHTYKMLHVFDLTGRLLKSCHLQHTHYPIQLSVSDLNAGVYLLRLLSETGHISSKFLKNN